MWYTNVYRVNLFIFGNVMILWYIYYKDNNGNISIENSQLPNISISTNSIDLQSLASNSFNTGFTLTNNGEDGSVLIYDIDIDNLNYVFDYWFIKIIGGERIIK